MKSRLLPALGLLALAVFGFALGYLIRSSSRPVVAPTPKTPADYSGSQHGPFTLSAEPPPTFPATAAQLTISPLQAAIERLLALLERGAATPTDLTALRAKLLTADPAEATAAIRAFLRFGRNSVTREEFALGPGGVLAGAPTLRVLLLDTLGQIARPTRDPSAAEVSREILTAKGSADEWALALRNLAWTEPQTRTYLADKVREMLGYDPWRRAPSAGMLEALDVGVFTRDPTLIPDLAEARSAGGELAHATDIALDRLAEAAPLEVLTWLNTHPRTLDDRPFLRADYFAKADLAQGAQRAQVEIYLGRPDISAAEKAKLLKALVTPASFVGETLLSTTTAPDDGTARRAALLHTVAGWLKNERFPLLREALLHTQGRLTP